ncbi:MAG: sel1 repeat family protein [Nitrospirota bacterium]|nr:sel1 repeat family protein [Nitrospirota bacterium]
MDVWQHPFQPETPRLFNSRQTPLSNIALKKPLIMRYFALLVLLIFSSGCNAYLCAARGICGPHYLDESETEWDKGIGSHKDSLITINGSFDRCTPLTNGGEVCEWQLAQGNHKLIYAFDQNQIAQSWSYQGTFGSRTSQRNQKSANETKLTISPDRTKIQPEIDPNKRVDYSTELEKWQPLAEQGNPEAQFKLSLMYIKSQGGISKDYAEAARWSRLAADQGHVGAQVLLGSLYHDGWGVPQDYDEALRWFRLAAEQGNADAQAKLGYIYYKGQGVSQDPTEAFRWYKMAAEQGEKVAQVRLGAMYATGHGVLQDYVQALKWSILVAQDGSEFGAKIRDDISNKLTAEKIAEAQRLAREWMEQHAERK